MLSRIARAPHRGLGAGVFLMAALGSSSLAGQELPLQRDYPGSGPYVCPTGPTPATATPAQRSQAGQLASDADQAVILGDLERAAELLERAAEVDPSSADLAYRHARVLESLGEVEPAMLEFCRSLVLDSGTSADISDASVRLDALYERVREQLSDVARNAFIVGIERADSAMYRAAVASFTVAMDNAPEWGAPIYNRAVLYEEMGLIEESLIDYRRYLDIFPTAIDPVVARVSERIGLLEGMVTITAPSPTGAFALGLLPGMGHYYSRRPVSGTLVLTLASSAIAAGFLMKDVTVVCLNEVPAGGACSENDVVEEITDRPMLPVGLGVAAAVTLIGAVEALIKARNRSAQAAAISGETTARGPSLRAPTVTTRGGRVAFELLRLSFR